MHPEYGVVELGDPRLRRVAKFVPNERASQTVELFQLMRNVMDALGGVGIAAPQLGEDWQMLIIASRPSDRYPQAPHMAPLYMVNPKPISYSENQVSMWEGCLSVPGLRGRVLRAASVVVQYTDVHGQKHQLELDGFPARVFLHEYDHLLGKVFIDRVQSTDELVTEKVYRERIGS